MYTLTQFIIGPLVTAALGTAVVALVWTIVALVRARRGPVRTAVATSSAEAIGVAGLVAILAFALVPNPGVRTTINVVPIVGLVANLLSSNWQIAIANAFGNLAVFVPIGIALRWRFNASVLRAGLVGLGISLAVELAQLVANNGRSVDVDDVILNVTGTMIGVWLVIIVGKALPSDLRRPGASVSSPT